MRTLLSLALVAYVFAVPLPEKAVDKRRESTKETIQLEDTLKRLAGENKKFFSNAMAQPMPQVDGLEDHGGSGEVGHSPGSPPVPVNPLEEQLKVVEAGDEKPEQPDTSKELEQELPNDDSEMQQAQEEALHEEPQEDEALEDEIEAVRHPIPGPYGPGLESSKSGAALEYEPEYMGDHDEDSHMPEEQGTEAEDEDYFLERVMETLRRHPDLLNELMQENQEVEEEDAANALDKRAPSIDEPDLHSLVDYEDRVNAIQAELSAIRAQNDPQFAAAYQRSLENEQNYLGDQESHIVAKKKSLPGREDMSIPKEYLEDNIESLNRYFDTYAADEHSKRGDIPIM